jgi:Zn-dependent protease with chaperone function
MYFKILLFSFLIALSLPTHSADGEKMMLWRVKELAKASNKIIKLRNDKDRVVGTVDVNQLVNIYAATVAIKEVAEIDAILTLTDGDDPNAFATKIKMENGEFIDHESINAVEVNIIAFNFGILEMFGNDYDAAAAIIGHELAHLKLEHLEDSKEAKQKNTEGRITAANTKYSRDNERDADYLGVIWSIEAGYDPNGVVRAQESLYNYSKRKGGTFGTSHPSSIERITVLKSLVRRLSR